MIEPFPFTKEDLEIASKKLADYIDQALIDKYIKEDKIMRKERALNLHRKMWGWLAENPMRSKYQWPEWTKNGGTILPVEMECFACEYCDGSCRHCMFEWVPNATRHCVCERNPKSLYYKWLRSFGIEKMQYAALIRDMPVWEK